MIRARIVAFFLVLLLTGNGVRQQLEHGEGGNDGPHLGAVHFVTSCNAAAQKQMDHAVALLHSFQFNHAIQGFNAALKSDAGCGIAYWGMGLSQWTNPFAAGMKDQDQMQAGRESAERGRSTGAKTERERDYIAAMSNLYSDSGSKPQQVRLTAYRDAMGAVAAKYPEDHEAQIFYALAIAASEEPSDTTHLGRIQAGEILEKLFRQEPNHPGLAHYIIHTYDVPTLAAKALAAARRYSEIAPDAPHALHMPSHTFTRAGYWQDSIDSNRSAITASRREGQTAEELHASDYQAYAYLQTAQDEAARKLLESLPGTEARFEPKLVVSGAAGPSAGFFALAAIPARYALERGDWKSAVQLKTRETPFPYADAMTWFARGMGAARLHEAAIAKKSVDALQQIQVRLEKANEKYWAIQVGIERQEVNAWTSLALQQKDLALKMMRDAVQMEDGTDKSAITPGPLAPARELLGEMLLELNEPKQALEQFEATLRKEPNRFRALYGAARSAQLSGNSAASHRYFRELLKVCEHADQKPGRAELIEAKRAIGGEQPGR